MLSDIEIEGIKILRKYRNAVDLLYHDTKFRYSIHGNLIALHCLMHDDFLDIDEETTFEKKTVGTIVTYNTSTEEIDILHDMLLHTWIYDYCKDGNFIDNLELNLIFIEDEAE